MTLALLAGVAPAQAAVEVDQSAWISAVATTTGPFASVFGSVPAPRGAVQVFTMAQSITAGKSGYLDHIDLQLISVGFVSPPAGSLVLRLYEGGIASNFGTLVTSVTLPPSVIPTRQMGPQLPADFTQISLRSANYLVAPGQVFTIELAFLADVPPGSAAVIVGTSAVGSTPSTVFNAYAGGERKFTNSQNPGVLSASQAGDMGFRTFVDVAPGAVPEPASWTMMIGGFALAGGALRSRRGAVRFA